MKPALLFLLFFLFVTVVVAQNHRDEFGIQTDNDSYLGNHSDRYYTDGLFFFYRHALLVKTDSSSLQNKILGFELGQKIFNPQSGVIPSGIYVDRPFAGYLYAGSTLNLLYKNESNIKLSAQLGVVGPASLAQNAQQFVHNTFGFYHIVGWQYQIKNDFELNLGMEYNKLLARGSMADVSLASYANLGTGFTGAGMGPLLRIGAFNQLFHSQSTQSNVIATDKLTPLHQHEFFFYYKPQINWIAYDATIQGGLFEKHEAYSYTNPEVVQVPKPIVFSQQIGLAFSINRWVFDLSAIFHTKDTEVMVQSHQWGSVTALYHFH